MKQQNAIKLQSAMYIMIEEFYLRTVIWFTKEWRMNWADFLMDNKGFLLLVNQLHFQLTKLI